MVKVWTLVMLLLVITMGGYSLWPKAHVKAPVVVSAQVDEEAGTMTVSYITTKRDKTFLTDVMVEGSGFYPDETAVTQELAEQNGYQLREDEIELSEEDLAFFYGFSGYAIPVSISYENHAPNETLLIVLSGEEAVEGTMEEDLTLRYSFTAPEEMAVASVGHYDSSASLSYEQNGKVPKLPLEMKKGDRLDILLHETVKLGSDDRVLVEIQTTEDTYYKMHLKETVPLPEAYLKRLVKDFQ
ncbi:hypothetical protein [Planococcus sp. ISL-109]|uniref:hypothetical protein n=1 Tax=Planococcus sp. ISL-109 TaxID=2819166 RepID=UPI001BED029A|nr:hypothetical protein [Planococcus sp. ISL-109]MBT2583337.1 hypothetical protein [Planococcus sp. ISL-109]